MIGLVGLSGVVMVVTGATTWVCTGTVKLGVETSSSVTGSVALEELETSSSSGKNSTVSSDISIKRASASLVVESEWNSRDRRSDIESEIQVQLVNGIQKPAGVGDLVRGLWRKSSNRRLVACEDRLREGIIQT